MQAGLTRLFWNSSKKVHWIFDQCKRSQPGLDTALFGFYSVTWYVTFSGISRVCGPATWIAHYTCTVKGREKSRNYAHSLTITLDFLRRIVGFFAHWRVFCARGKEPTSRCYGFFWLASVNEYWQKTASFFGFWFLPSVNAASYLWTGNVNSGDKDLHLHRNLSKHL